MLSGRNIVGRERDRRDLEIERHGPDPTMLSHFPRFARRADVSASAFPPAASVMCISYAASR